MSPNLPNPYQVLGVSETATDGEIKKAYRKLAKQNHPDSNQGDKKKEARFKDISAAYNIVGTAEKRAKFEELRRAGPGAIPDGVFDLGDLFNQMFGGSSPFGGGSPGARRPRGQGVRYEVQRGAPRRGQPQAQSYPFSDFGSVFGDMPGRQQPRKSKPAKSAKKKTVRRKVILSDGSKAKVSGLDIHSDVRLSFDKAILGTVATIITKDGKANLRIPPGSSSGTQLRLRGKGLKHRDGRVGNHYITIQIDVPKKISEEAARLLVQFVDNVKVADNVKDDVKDKAKEQD